MQQLSLDVVAEALAERRKKPDSDGHPLDVVALVLAFGSSLRPKSDALGRPWEQSDELRKTDADARAAIAVHANLSAWIR